MPSWDKSQQKFQLCIGPAGILTLQDVAMSWPVPAIA